MPIPVSNDHIKHAGSQKISFIKYIVVVAFKLISHFVCANYIFGVAKTFYVFMIAIGVFFKECKHISELFSIWSQTRVIRDKNKLGVGMINMDSFFHGWNCQSGIGMLC